MTDSNSTLIDIITELQANGWEYGTHPRDKAMKVIEAVRKWDAEQPSEIRLNDKQIRLDLIDILIKGIKGWNEETVTMIIDLFHPYIERKQGEIPVKEEEITRIIYDTLDTYKTTYENTHNLYAAIKPYLKRETKTEAMLREEIAHLEHIIDDELHPEIERLNKRESASEISDNADVLDSDMEGRTWGIDCPQHGKDYNQSKGQS